ncbi:MAG: hypothetical protein Q4Q04_04025 [Methanocorpusculum sp.]|nr:hypothetical protein [Methanocorpusculum sp.]
MDCESILGTWHGVKTIPLLASGACTITFLEDKTARVAGKLHVFGHENDIRVDDLRWNPLGNNRYLGSYGEHELPFVLNAQGTLISARVNPYKLGAVDNPRFNVEIPLDLRRVRQK